MFPKSYFPTSYFPPSYWPKEGAVPTGGGVALGKKRKDLIRRLLMQDLLEQAERAEAIARKQTGKTRLQEAIDSMATNFEIARRQKLLTATYSAILSEI